MTRCTKLRLAALISFALTEPFLSAQAISFLAPINTPISANLGYCTLCIVNADFNGDGKADVTYVGSSGATTIVGVALGNGDGTFQPSASFSINFIGGPSKIFAADFNHDGHPDLLISGSSTYLYLGKGDGTFQAQLSVTGCPAGPPAPVPVSVVADLSGDGAPDLVCGTTVLLGNGDGTFHSGVPVDAVATDTAILTADFNRDGILDIVMQHDSGSLLIALGNGDGTFGSGIAYPVNDALYGTVAADFNGDGKIDLTSYDSTEGLIVFTPGDGTFGAAVDTLTYGILEPSAVADFNSDGKPDLLTTAGAVLAGNGDGAFLGPVFFGSTGLATTGDFNNDGLPDLVQMNPAPGSGLSALLNDSPGDGLLAPGVSSATFRWTLGPDSIVSAFGENLAPETATATSYPAQTTLGGIRVHVGVPPNDTLAPLTYVSPTQINYLLPDSDGFVQIGIERVGSPYVPQGIGVTVTQSVVSFYTIAAGIAAAYAVRAAPGGAQTPVPVFSCTSGFCTAVPIDVSGDPVYVSLFGTGFDTTGAGFICTTGTTETEIPVTYAGPQEQIPGLDQVNLMLPRSLAGSGTISITCQILTQTSTVPGLFGSTIPGPPSNPVAIAIQ